MLQARDDLVVGGLGEIGIELSDAVEGLRRVNADEGVGGTYEPAGPIWWCHWNGQDDMSRAVFSGNLTGGSCCRPGSDAVIDDDDRSSFERDGLPIAPEPPSPPFQFGPLPLVHGSQVCRRNPGHPDHVGVEDPNAPFADGTHCQLGLKRHSQLANKDDVQGRGQPACHFECD
jgi:hypothetical protein